MTTTHDRGGRLTTLQAALIVARRDFRAVLFSRSFIAFLIGPLFMLAVTALASSVGQQVEQNAGRPRLGVAMSPGDTAAVLAAAHRLDPQLDRMLPEDIGLPPADGSTSPRALLASRHEALDAVLTGSPAAPVLTGPEGMVETLQPAVRLLAAAIPMDAVILGKLFAMLAVSFVGIAVWGLAATGVLVAAGHSLSDLPAPAVGWPLFLALGITYFAMAYLLLGAVFLTIGSMASTVREVQTLSMPVTMLQLLVFFFATYAVGAPHSWSARAAEILPFSSPFTMLARAAMEPALVPHLLALGWQAAWVALFVRFGAQLFRRRVMKSGPGGRVTRPRRRAARQAA